MIYDITQELFSSVVYPGDTCPEAIRLRDFCTGDAYQLTDIKMCAHNGTHLDAPLHFVREGKSIDQIDLERFMGRAEVISDTRQEQILASTSNKLLLKGCEGIDESLAEQLIRKGIQLLGVEGQSVGNPEVHRLLLSHDVVVLEGIRLETVPEGTYTLFAVPLKLGGCEGSPCRAFLLDEVI